MFHFPLNQLEEPFAQPNGRNSQLVPGGRLGIAGKHVKDCGSVLPDGFGTGKHPQIRIQFGGGIVVIPSPQMDIPADAVLLLAHYQRNLAVGL